MMMRTWTALLVLVAVSACVTASDVAPMGRDSYMITGHASGGLNAGKGMMAATQHANAYCTSLHKVMMPGHSETHGMAAVGGESTTFVFSCLDENDPAYTRPTVRSDPNVVIEDQRH
jgi:hypothetical protein